MQFLTIALTDDRPLLGSVDQILKIVESFFAWNHQKCSFEMIYRILSSARQWIKNCTIFSESKSISNFIRTKKKIKFLSLSIKPKRQRNLNQFIAYFLSLNLEQRNFIQLNNSIKSESVHNTSQETPNKQRNFNLIIKINCKSDLFCNNWTRTFQNIHYIDSFTSHLYKIHMIITV